MEDSDHQPPRIPPEGEVIKTGNYDMKAKVVAEKLKGRKDLEVIEWARNTLNFQIQYRRNIYRWKKNPIIFKLAQQYAGLIDNAEVPDKIKNSYRVLNSKVEDLNEFLIEFIGMAVRYEVPITEHFIRTKFFQLCPLFGLTTEESDGFVGSACDRLKKIFKRQLKDVETKYLKSITKQLHVRTAKELKTVVESSNWRNVYYYEASTIQYQLADKYRMGLYDLNTSNNNNEDEDEDIETTHNEDHNTNEYENNETFAKPVPYLTNELITMIHSSSLDGTKRCGLSFIGSDPNPPKFNVLSRSCKYYYSETGWITTAFFESYLKVLSKDFDSKLEKIQGEKLITLLVEDIPQHDIPDGSIPSNIRLVLIDQELFTTLDQSKLSVVQIIIKKHRILLLKSLEKTLEILQSINYNDSKPTRKISDFIINSLQNQMVESLNLLNEIWLTLSPSVFEDIIYSSVVSQLSNKLIKIDAIYKDLENQTNSILEKITKNDVYSKTNLPIINHLINIDRNNIQIENYIKVNELTNSRLERDYIFMKTRRKLNLKLEFEKYFSDKIGGRKIDEEIHNKLNETDKPKPNMFSISSLLNDEQQIIESKREISDNEENDLVLKKSRLNESTKLVSQEEQVFEFKKAVVDLHVQFVENPIGPFKSRQIYREMSFEEIFSQTLNE